MAKYRLSDGTEFDVRPAGLGPESDRAFEMLSELRDGAETNSIKVKRFLYEVLKICAPDGVADNRAATALIGRFDEIIGDAFPGVVDVETEGESKNAERPGDSSGGSGPDSKASASTPADTESEMRAKS